MSNIKKIFVETRETVTVRKLFSFDINNLKKAFKEFENMDDYEIASFLRENNGNIPYEPISGLDFSLEDALFNSAISENADLDPVTNVSLDIEDFTQFNWNYKNEWNSRSMSPDELSNSIPQYSFGEPIPDEDELE